jgi:hypothetical protein
MERENKIKSNDIPIAHKNTNLNNQYSLKNQIFDPFKNSPPNEFIRKLKIRMRTKQ